MNRIAGQIPEPILSNPTPQLINNSGLDRLEIYKFIDENGKQEVTLKQKNNIEKTKKISKKPKGYY
jgi:hypothetical protein